MKKDNVPRRIILLIAAVLLCLVTYSQPAIGEWQAHLAYHDASKCIKAFNRIYVVSDHSLYSYDPSDNNVQTFDKTVVLSDNGIADIDWCAAEKAIIICYLNGNIDLLYGNDDIYNITDLVNSRLNDKTVNEVKVYGRVAYISTNSGIVKLDVIRKEISDTYLFEGGVLSVLLHDGWLFCTGPSGVYKGKNTDNLLDLSKWIRLSERTIFNRLHIYLDKPVIEVTDGNLFFFDETNFSLKFIDRVHYACQSEGILYLFNWDRKFIIYDTTGKKTTYNINFTVKYAISEGNDLWLCCSDKGLQKCSVRNGDITVTKPSILPDSPRRNYFDFMNISDDGRLLVAGGSLNYAGIDYEGTLMEYSGRRWNNFSEDGITEQTGLKYINLTSLAEDPMMPGHFFAGSARQGLYEYRDYKFVKLHTFDNSPLKTILPDNPRPYDFVSVDGLQYDREGNLWMLNNEVDTIFRIIKNDGNWTALYYPEIANKPTFKFILFDSRGFVWTAATRYSPGIFCLDTNGTLDNQNDDKSAFNGHNFTNQDGITVTVNYIYFIEEDHNGILWIGTDQGIFIINDPSSFINESNHIFNRVKIPRNDGTGQADYLLNGIYTTAACIDYANRKWIGTMSNGIFLLDADGTTTIHHFTTENSPLLSDNIINIKTNGTTGEVYIATDKGLITYGGDAFKPNENLDKSDILIYPNPVLPENEGMVTIRGLSYNCTVKILNSAGRLVHQGTSTGGSYTWNCGYGRQRVTSGMYYVMAVSEDGRQSIVKSFTIIK